MIPAKCLTSFNKFQLPSSEETPRLLQPHQGNMPRSWLRDTDIRMEIHCYVRITNHYVDNCENKP